MTDDGLRGVAYHEAGHAVVALALGLHVPASRFSTRTVPAGPTSRAQVVFRWWTGLQFFLRG